MDHDTKLMSSSKTKSWLPTRCPATGIGVGVRVRLYLQQRICWEKEGSKETAEYY